MAYASWLKAHGVRDMGSACCGQDIKNTLGRVTARLKQAIRHKFQRGLKRGYVVPVGLKTQMFMKTICFMISSGGFGKVTGVQNISLVSHKPIWGRIGWGRMQIIQQHD